MQIRLLKHLNVHNILSNEQYNFRTKLKTDSATYQLANDILNANLIGGIFCDLEKAYDCVNHKVLVSRLEFYGITGNHHKLYKSYLTNRYQRTLLLGLVLGPLHILICVNALRVSVRDKTVPILFADNSSILLCLSNPTDFKNNINTF